jgi:alcohol dehydrogenase (NADP+)
MHAVRNEWGGTTYPIVPGHEIVGKVTKVGNQFTKFKPGNLAAVRCIINPCRECKYCKEGLEQNCYNGWTVVFGSPDKHMEGTPMEVSLKI